jgi:tripartite-type tricarboxylate transporter receptor subunit TctC
MNKIICLHNYHLLAAAALAMACTAAAQPQQSSQGYPRKPIRLIVGFPPGGNADASARLMALRMGEALGTTLVVENRSGAGGSIAAQIASRAAADGYTLLWSSPGALTINRILEQNLPYNADTAFIPVGRTFTFANALIVRGDSPQTSVAQLLAAAKDKPGQLQYGTQGVGSAGHLSAQMLQNLGGITLNHIPYKGGSELVTAVVGGELPAGFVSTLAAGSMRSRVRVLAVTSLQRDGILPDVPSMHEAGVKNYDASFWFGVMAPAGTPTAIVQRLNKELRDALADAEVVRLARSQGLNPAPSTPQEFAAVIKADYEKWKKVIGRS